MRHGLSVHESQPMARKFFTFKYFLKHRAAAGFCPEKLFKEPPMNFQAHLRNMLEMMQEEFLVLFLGGLLVQLLVSLTLGILAGPLMGGYLLAMMQWLRTGRRCEFNDLFSGLKRFPELFPFCIMGLLVFLGYLLLIVPGVLMTVWWVYVLPLMAHQGLSLGAAMSASKNKVSEKGFFMHLVFLLLISLVPVFVILLAAAIVPPLAVLQYFLFPLQSACLASLYLEQFTDFDPEKRGKESIDVHGFAAPAGSPVPPPVPDENDQGRAGRVGRDIQPAW
jgi:hypothetical protein